MIKLLLVVGVAGALTSSADAKIETFGVDRSSDEIGTCVLAFSMMYYERLFSDLFRM